MSLLADNLTNTLALQLAHDFGNKQKIDSKLNWANHISDFVYTSSQMMLSSIEGLYYFANKVNIGSPLNDSIN